MTLTTRTITGTSRVVSRATKVEPAVKYASKAKTLAVAKKVARRNAELLRRLA